MNNQAVEFVQNQLLRAESRLKPYTQSTDGLITYPKRYAFFRFEKLLNDFLNGQQEQRWVVMPGISGVGKTTILAQLYKQYNSIFNNNHILSISLDDASLSNISLKDILEAYEYILGINYEELKQPVLILIDEAHRDQNWSSALKVLWGRTKNVFFICTGSSAVLLAPHLDDIGRRITVEKLYPLSFTEYEAIKKDKPPENYLAQKIKEAVYNSTNSSAVFEQLKTVETNIASQWSLYDRIDLKEYMSIGTIPFALHGIDEPNVFLAIDRIVDKLIQKDIVELNNFQSETLKQIKPLLLFLARGSTISISKICTEFNLNKNTLQDILDVLVTAEILIKITPFKAENKAYKYLFMCPAIRNALLDISGLKATQDTRRGDTLEDVAGLHLYREFIAQGYGKVMYDPEQGGADFILDLRSGRRITIEIGTGTKGISQVERTIMKTKSDYGIIFCSDPLTLYEKENIVKIPLDFFFLI